MHEAFEQTQDPGWVLSHQGYDVLSESAVESRFAFFLGMRARSLGQPVASSEVIAATQIVPGVVAVTLTALHLTGTPSTVAPVLTARSASGASGSVIGSPLPPAQLLTINPSGLTVTELIL